MGAEVNGKASPHNGDVGDTAPMGFSIYGCPEPGVNGPPVLLCEQLVNDITLSQWQRQFYFPILTQCLRRVVSL